MLKMLFSGKGFFSGKINANPRNLFSKVLESINNNNKKIWQRIIKKKY